MEAGSRVGSARVLFPFSLTWRARIHTLGYVGPCYVGLKRTNGVFYELNEQGIRSFAVRLTHWGPGAQRGMCGQNWSDFDGCTWSIL